jgi:hypothetical protein
MKKLLTVLTLLVAHTMCLAQSDIHFGNTLTTLLMTNDNVGPIGPISPASDYRIGLYIGSFTADPGSLSIVAAAFNSSTPGRFEGGNVLAPFSPGVQLSFEVRAWSAFAGNSYEEAITFGANNPGVLAGISGLGSFTLPASGTVELFGTAPGQVGGFVLTPVPEPSTWLIALAAGMLLLFRRQAR